MTLLLGGVEARLAATGVLEAGTVDVAAGRAVVAIVRTSRAVAAVERARRAVAPVVRTCRAVVTVAAGGAVVAIVRTSRAVAAVERTRRAIAAVERTSRTVSAVLRAGRTVITVVRASRTVSAVVRASRTVVAVVRASRTVVAVIRASRTVVAVVRTRRAVITVVRTSRTVGAIEGTRGAVVTVEPARRALIGLAGVAPVALGAVRCTAGGDALVARPAGLARGIRLFGAVAAVAFAARTGLRRAGARGAALRAAPRVRRVEVLGGSAALGLLVLGHGDFLGCTQVHGSACRRSTLRTRNIVDRGRSHTVTIRGRSPRNRPIGLTNPSAHCAVSRTDSATIPEIGWECAGRPQPADASGECA